jgi:hypothetical protein
MGIISFEGCEGMASFCTGLTGGWNSRNSSIQSKSGTTLLGGSSTSYGNGASVGQFYYVGNANIQRWIVGARFFWSNPATSPGTIHILCDGTSAQCGLSVNGSSKLFAWRNSTATVLGTGTTSLLANSWYYIEMDATIAGGTSGSIKVNIDGTQELNLTSINTQQTGNAFASNYLCQLGDGITNGFSDDHYLLDPSSGPYNTFLGPCRVETLFPTSAGSTIQWTPNASTNVSQIQDSSYDGDTTFNSTTGAAIDLFGHGAITGTPAQIYAARVCAIARKDDNTQVGFRTKLVSGSTTANGTTTNIATGYNISTQNVFANGPGPNNNPPENNDIYVTDPATGVAWTATGIGASIIGYEHT